MNVWLSLVIKKSNQEQQNETSLVIYAGMLGTALFFNMLQAFLFFHISLKSSEQLHDRMTLAILKAPVLFFDTNPVGRILNRFSKDIGSMDEVLPAFFPFCHSARPVYNIRHYFAFVAEPLDHIGCCTSSRQFHLHCDILSDVY